MRLSEQTKKKVVHCTVWWTTTPSSHLAPDYEQDMILEQAIQEYGEPTTVKEGYAFWF